MAPEYVQKFEITVEIETNKSSRGCTFEMAEHESMSDVLRQVLGWLHERYPRAVEEATSNEGNSDG